MQTSERKGKGETDMKSVVALLARRLTIFCPSRTGNPGGEYSLPAHTLSCRFDASLKSEMMAWVESWAPPLERIPISLDHNHAS